MFIRYLWPALTWAAFILVICAVPGHNFPKLSFLEWLGPDKLVHLLVFGILSWLLARGFQRQSSSAGLSAKPLFYSLILTILYGILIEVLQDQVFTGRNGDARDAMANALGALAGIWLYRKRKTEGVDVGR